jgi:hypothetical protein
VAKQLQELTDLEQKVEDFNSMLLKLRSPRSEQGRGFTHNDVWACITVVARLLGNADLTHVTHTASPAQVAKYPTTLVV